MSQQQRGKNHGSKKRPNKGKGGNPRGQQPRRSGRKPSTLDPNLLVKEASVTEVKKYESKRRVVDLPVDKRIIENLVKKGYERPTEIQDRSIEKLIEGRNMMGIAQTGTGKTGAFLIPIIELLLKNKKPLNNALIVLPTRELAVQVEDEFKSMTKGLGLFSSCFIGGTNINRDLNRAKGKNHIIIGTPGRILDLRERKALDLRRFQTLVLDEFDRMLDMGFAREVDKIIHGMQNRKQTMLFSATLDKKQQKQIDEILKKPVVVKVSTGQASTDNVSQEIIRLNEGDDKFRILTKMLSEKDFEKVILFEETKHRVNRLCTKLNKAGFKAVQIQGNKSQNQRQKALNDFKKGKASVLVATDVAGRGIDVDNVTHVINYQVPDTYDAYIHRVGRTGRAGRVGKAITFVDHTHVTK